MAKEIKTRAHSLELALEDVEVKHPLVQLTHPQWGPLSDSFFEVLDASEGPVGGHCIRRSRTFHQRTNVFRDCKRRTTYHKTITTHRAIIYCHPHIIVRLVSCAFHATDTPIYNCFSIRVPRFIRCSARNSHCAIYCAISTPDAATVVRNQWHKSKQNIIFSPNVF